MKSTHSLSTEQASEDMETEYCDAERQPEVSEIA